MRAGRKEELRMHLAQSEVIRKAVGERRRERGQGGEEGKLTSQQLIKPENLVTHTHTHTLAHLRL